METVFDKADRDPMPVSTVDNVTIRNAHLYCTRAFYRDRKTDYVLTDFTFRDIEAESVDPAFDTSNIENVIVENVTIKPAEQK